jgi:hypothetical protein
MIATNCGGGKKQSTAGLVSGSEITNLQTYHPIKCKLKVESTGHSVVISPAMEGRVEHSDGHWLHLPAGAIGDTARMVMRRQPGEEVYVRIHSRITTFNTNGTLELSYADCQQFDDSVLVVAHTEPSGQIDRILPSYQNKGTNTVITTDVRGLSGYLLATP